ncbi:MAG: BtaA family protein [Flavobacteriales bacterium]|nr:BtaA family protein [Flavobacteriales bacterium]
MSNNKRELSNVSFDFVRYANCWEDADVLTEALEVQQGEKVLSIASAGDNSFSLLINQPEVVVAVDVNPIQLHLIELKRLAIKYMSQEEYLAFVGFVLADPKEKLKTYERLKSELSSEARAYWDQKTDAIEKGIINDGKFERYFRMFAKRVVPLIHSRKTTLKLMEEKDAQAQIDFYNDKWHTWRWKWFFKTFFSNKVMGWLGRDPSFLNEVEGSVSTFILNKAKEHLSSVYCQDNLFLNYAMTGKFLGKLPHYCQEGNYERVKENIDALVLFKGLVQDVAPKYNGFHAFNLSNIFEYLNEDITTGVAKSLEELAAPGARVAYWNLMVDRFLSNYNPKFQYQKEKSESFSERDKGFFYKRFVLDLL